MTTPQIPSRFSAENSALLLIDHQVGTMQLIKNISRDLAARQSIALAKMAKILDMPVVITSSQEEHAQGPILPAIAEIQPNAHAKRIKRPGVVNAWACPAFRDAVLATGRKNLIMAGGFTSQVSGDARVQGRHRHDLRRRWRPQIVGSRTPERTFKPLPGPCVRQGVLASSMRGLLCSNVQLPVRNQCSGTNAATVLPR